MESYILKTASLLMVIYFTVVLSEIGAYAWHRILAHRSIIGNIFGKILQPMRDSHAIHHTSDLKHLAKEDFVWVKMMLYVFLKTVLLVGTYIGYVSKLFLYTFVITVFSVYCCNQKLHEAVHSIKVEQGSTEEEKYRKGSVFKSYLCDSRDIHFVHHSLPSKNYSITNFADVIFGTYSSGFHHTQKEVEEMLDL